MFVDIVDIYIKAGDGGNGAVSFRREKFIAAGGPDGGDGGKGGNVIFEVETGKHTLMDFRYKRSFKAGRGEDGKGKKMHGKSGNDIIIKVPQGTILRHRDSGKIIADMARADDRRVVVSGGRGGHGNTRFATPTRQTPRFAKGGTKGQELWVTLELKSIADVGLIGYPNVGKSTLLSVVTASKPKIADYHFTTLAPNLGVVRTRYGKSFIMADIPGIIEGAHKGVGLGTDFLRHIERTRVLVHVIDVSGIEGRDPLEDFHLINNELKSFSDSLAERPQIVVANKIDLLSDDENLNKLKEALSKEGIKVFPASAAINEGLDALLDELVLVLEDLPPLESFEEDFVYDEEQREEPFTIEIDEDGIYMVSGPLIEGLLASVNLEDYESMQYFQQFLRREGIIDALREAGINEGETVQMMDVEFDFID